jgi:hypothetical protein
MANADRMAPLLALTAFVVACVERSKYFGTATAARIPKITMIMTNSISVKPFCALIIFFSSSIWIIFFQTDASSFALK